MLEVSALTLGYGGAAVAAFSGMRLEKGEHCLILGPSGSGKTTLLYSLAGMVPVLGGSVKVEGTDVCALDEAARDTFRGAHIGIVYQGLHLVKSLTVLQNVMLAAYASGKPVAAGQAEALLTRLGLAEKLHVLPAALSQGQAQRVAIARSALHKPALLLADEPTSSLDDASCEAVIALLKDVAAQAGSSLVIATHDNRVKAHFSNTIVMGAA